jgi:hypothetical protein
VNGYILFTIYKYTTSSSSKLSIQPSISLSVHLQKLFIPYFLSFFFTKSSNQNLGILGKLIRRNFKVQRCRSLTNPSTHIIMRSMTRTEPPIEISSSTNGHTAKMSTDPKNYQPLRLVHSLIIRLLITQMCHGNRRLHGNFRRCSMTNKHGLTTPLDRNGLTRINVSQIKFSRCQSENVSRGTHGRNEFDHEDTGSGGVGKAYPREHEVGEGTTLGFGHFVDPVGSIGMIYRSEFMKGLLLVVGGDRGEERRRRDWRNILFVFSK